MMLNKFVAIVVTSVLVAAAVFTVFMYSDLFFNNAVKGEALAVDTYATSESVESLVEDMNSFSFELYKELSMAEEGNVFFSPYSVFVALAMAYEGARGETAVEMQKVLGFQQNNETWLCSFGRIYNLYNQKSEYTLKTANALWVQHGYSFLMEYLDFIEKYYMGKASVVDFTNAEKTADLINSWTNDRTNGKIPELIKTVDINPLTKLILTNAIYFRGDWVYQFNPNDTEVKKFSVSDNVSLNVSMMSFYDEDVELNYAENEDLQILELPYRGEKVSMLILLPKENNVSVIEKRLNNENLTRWTSSLRRVCVRVYLPRFKLETTYKLKPFLMNMGIHRAFTYDADFSGMDNTKDLFIEKVIHKAFIEVDENGTEAAAATSVHVVLKGMPDYVTFNADHPFLFLIKHRETGNILFMGKISYPENV